MMSFAQELQSPQLSQHAIFANPALAGQMAYTRIGASLSTYKSSKFTMIKTVLTITKPLKKDPLIMVF